LELGLLLRDHLGAPLLRLQGCARGSDPLAALLELGTQDAQLARARIELARLLAQPVRLGRHVRELGLPVLQLLLGERDAALAVPQITLGLLDQLPARVEVGADLLVPARTRVDLRRAAGNRLVEQALAVSERLPCLFEL